MRAITLPVLCLALGLSACADASDPFGPPSFGVFAVDAKDGGSSRGGSASDSGFDDGRSGDDTGDPGPDEVDCDDTGLAGTTEWSDACCRDTGEPNPWCGE